MTGIAYSLFAGQPLTILGSTGPVLVFEKILFKFCKYVVLSYLACPCINGVSVCYSLTPVDFGVLLCFSQGLRPLLPLPEGLHRPVDGLLLSLAGRHRRQLAGVLHHSLHRGSFCRTDLHHFHLRSTGETDPPGCSLPRQQKQQFTETNAVLVSISLKYLNLLLPLHK